MTYGHGVQGASGGAHSLARLASAALDSNPVSGWTHNFYRYPARFSPTFARAAIEHFSEPGDLIADPYMGGGTAVVEGLALGRHALGNDVNSLASFVARVKTTSLTACEVEAIRLWSASAIPALSYRVQANSVLRFIDPGKTRNLSIYRARFLKKAIAAALVSIEELPTYNAQCFVKCALLRVGQWALDGRKRHTELSEFRDRLAAVTREMLASIQVFGEHARNSGGRATIFNMDAANLSEAPFFEDCRQRASLIVTSPPYPGVHVLYHRWQIDGRKESPAPFWITGCPDGQGASYYNFGDRRQLSSNNYFRKSLQTLLGIRKIIRDGGHVIQLVAFNRPAEQLDRYLENMESAGFVEVLEGPSKRIWRQVPNRKWHATLRGNGPSAREVVLVHRAV